MNIKKIVFGIIIVVVFFLFLSINQSQRIDNKEKKIMQAYQLLDDANKQWIRDRNEISKRSDIRKIRLKESNTKYTGENKEYFGKTVYEVTFPLEDGRAETEFMILYNLELTEIVGYGVVE
ncbi:hypothetical protein [Candidatus Galacturonibacter soehngenii]|uniref:Uncharacterized protein n=1 Tax=Candidatus Galacturonatibacter soehngenii TaxID=2307010 RepID=A0A7V7QP79_9FIRM|nr:hypothetical protein [Candidatus Galacturonibacter soehngenii]KAB1440695.1 hypothetical protein F7O84_02395 [Candidatus Galacturonibacter soehngenii]